MKSIKLFNEKVEVGISDLKDGNMRFFEGGDEKEIINNQSELGRKIGLEPDYIARINTIYKDRKNFTDYFEVDEKNIEEFCIKNSEFKIPASDGLVTKSKNIGILLPLADCLGVVVFDKRQNIFGVLHAGRHNVEQDGPRKFIDFLKEKFKSDSKDLFLYFSPCAQNYCVFALNNRKLLDIAKEQFVNAGVLEENVISSGIDTVSNDDFPSNSSGDKKMRFAIVARQK